jgi:hypothetical protein
LQLALRPSSEETLPARSGQPLFVCPDLRYRFFIGCGRLYGANPLETTVDHANVHGIELAMVTYPPQLSWLVKWPYQEKGNARQTAASRCR